MSLFSLPRELFLEIGKNLLDPRDHKALIDAYPDADLRSLLLPLMISAARENNQTTLLNWVTKHGYEEWVIFLISNGASVNEENPSGSTCACTPIRAAATFGQAKVVEIPVRRVVAGNGCASTPLHSAATFGHAGIVEILLNNGAEIDKANCFASTALHCAIAGDGCEAAAEHERIVALLMAKGARMGVCNRAGHTAFQDAVKWGNKAILRMLVEGVNVAAKDVCHVPAVTVVGFSVPE